MNFVKAFDLSHDIYPILREELNNLPGVRVYGLCDGYQYFPVSLSTRLNEDLDLFVVGFSYRSRDSNDRYNDCISVESTIGPVARRVVVGALDLLQDNRSLFQVRTTVDIYSVWDSAPASLIDYDAGACIRPIVLDPGDSVRFRFLAFENADAAQTACRG